MESQFGDATGGQFQHPRIVAGIGEASAGWIHRQISREKGEHVLRLVIDEIPCLVRVR